MLVRSTFLGDKVNVSEKQTSKLPLIGVLVVFAAVGFAFYSSQDADTSEQSPQKAKIDAPTAEKTPTVEDNTRKTESSSAAAPKVEAKAEEVVAVQDRERSEVKNTADPNDDPENALAGISYRDVQMWEIEDLQLPEKVKGGVLISKIHAKSSFAEAQVRPGDIVTHAHHSKIINFTDLENAVSGRTHSLIDVYRDGKAYQVVLNKPYIKPSGN